MKVSGGAGSDGTNIIPLTTVVRHIDYKQKKAMLHVSRHGG
jgi:hypothetical protein